MKNLLVFMIAREKEILFLKSLSAKNSMMISSNKNVHNLTGVMPFIITGKNNFKIINSAATRVDTAILDKRLLQVFGDKHIVSLKLRKLSLQSFKRFPIIIEKVPRLIDTANHLHQAVYLGDKKKIRHLLAEGFPIDSIEPSTEQTALHVSVSVENLEILKELLKYIEMKQRGINDSEKVWPSKEKESDTLETATSYCATEYHSKTVSQYFRDRNYINDEDCNGLNVVMMSVKIKNLAMVTVLIANKADILKFNDKSKSALQLVLDEQYFSINGGILFYDELCRKLPSYKEVAQVLINAGCRLYQACYFENSSKIVEYMLDSGFSPNSMEPHHKLSALHLSVIFEDTETVKLLLKKGACVNAVNHLGSTPLLLVYRANKKHTLEKLEILKILLSTEEVLLTSCNLEGFFQISIVLFEGNQDVIRTVMQSKIDFMAEDKFVKNNIFHCLALNKNPGVVEELKFSYVNKYHINSVNKIGHSPMHLSVCHNNYAMAHFLLDQQATPTCPANKNGYTPIHHAFSRFEPGCERQFDYYIERLLQIGVDPQCIFTKKNERQYTIFDFARRTYSLNRTKPVIAHLAMLQSIGVPITDMIFTKINSYPKLQKYFYKCQEFLSRRISGSITLLKLLTSSDKTMSRYVGQIDLVLPLLRLSCKQNLKFTFSYYNSTLQNKFSKGIQYRKFLDKISEVMSKIFEYRIHKAHMVIDIVTDYLDQHSLEQLYQLSEMTQ